MKLQKLSTNLPTLEQKRIGFYEEITYPKVCLSSVYKKETTQPLTYDPVEDKMVGILHNFL